MTYETTLAQAIALLSSGQRLSHSMAVALKDEGYDVPALISRYFKK